MSPSFLMTIQHLAEMTIVYFFAINTAYLILILMSIISLQRNARLRPLTKRVAQGQTAFAPAISVLAPAYNEQETIVESIKSFLMLNYPAFEIIVINDGSKDQTLERLKKAFLLEETRLISDDTLSETIIRGTYQSRIHPNLTVVDKANGGKADALNVGIGFSKYAIFCAVDSDSLLENDALLKVASPFFENPGQTIASGGTVRIANGSTVRHGRVEKIGLPRNFLVLMQVIEYTRSFLCGRIGWNMINSTLVISGAFGLFSKRAVTLVGGYKADSVGEDMELITRLHKYHLDNKIPYLIHFVPDPVCWTEAPADLKSLGKQRDRWQRGLADVLRRHKGMIGNPRYGFIGMLALPYYLLVEMLGPMIETFAACAIVFLLYMGVGSVSIFFTYFIASMLYGIVLSIAAVTIEEIFYSKYERPLQFTALFITCILEAILYRPISTVWRLRGIWNHLRGVHTWGHLPRAGFSKGPTP